MPATHLRRTLSVPAARANAAPYPSASRRSPRQLNRHRTLGEVGWWTVVGSQDHSQPVAPSEEQGMLFEGRLTPSTVEIDDVTLFNVLSDDQMALAPQPEYLAYELASLTLTPALSIAPQTPPRSRLGHRETSSSPSLSDASSLRTSSSSTTPPLFAPDFGTPESTPRRNRTRRNQAVLRTVTESEMATRAAGSRRRHLERVASSRSIVSRSPSHDENAPVGLPYPLN